MNDEFLWVEKYRPKTIEDCILPEQTKKTFLDFLDKGEVPTYYFLVLLDVERLQLPRHFVQNWGLMFMSLMARMKAGFLTLFGIMPRTSHLQSLLAASRSIKSSSSMKQTIPLPTYNSSLERLLRSSPETVDSFSLAIIKIKSLNPSIRDVLLSNLESKENKSKKILKQIRKS